MLNRRITVLVGILLIAAIPVLRRFVMNRLRPFFAGVVPRMLDVAQNPAKLATGLGGTVLLSLFNITALWASVKAVSPEIEKLIARYARLAAGADVLTARLSLDVATANLAVEAVLTRKTR